MRLSPSANKDIISDNNNSNDEEDFSEKLFLKESFIEKEQRLSDLAVLSIEPEELNKIDIEQMIN